MQYTYAVEIEVARSTEWNAMARRDILVAFKNAIHHADGRVMAWDILPIGGIDFYRVTFCADNHDHAREIVYEAESATPITLLEHGVRNIYTAERTQIG